MIRISTESLTVFWDNHYIYIMIQDISGKKLLILGANTETIPLIEKANKLNVFTIVTDYNPDAPAKKFADRKIDIDGSDIAALYEFVRREHVDGILVGVAEALLPAYQELCEIAGFPCYFKNKDQVEYVVDKSKFKSVCKKNGVRTVTEYITSDSKSSILYPVIVKPVDNSSAKGISVCYTDNQLDTAIEKALQFSSRKKYIIEEYMQGPEADVHYVIKDGIPVISCMFDRYENSVGSGLPKLPTAFIFPSKRLDSFIQTQDDSFKKIISDIGLSNGPMFFSGFIDNEGMLACTETGHRFTGSQEPLIVEHMTGFSIMEMQIRYSLTGETGEGKIEKLMDPHFKQWCCKLSPIIRPGEISRIKGIDKIKIIPELFYSLQSYFEGDNVSGEGTLRQIFARYFIATPTIDKMAEVINKIQDSLVVLDKNGESMIIQTFDTDLLRVYTSLP
jgi:biotin carboxylase